MTTSSEQTKLDKEEILKNETMTAMGGTLYGVIIFTVVVVLLGLPYVELWGWESLKEGGSLFLGNKFYFFTTAIFGIIVHEALHGLTWATFCKNGMNSIKYGMKWKYLMPFAHCKEPLSVSHYILGISMPGILLGLVPSAIALLSGNPWLMYFGLFFTGIASGDILILWKLRSYNDHYLIKDHSDKIGFMVLKNYLNKVESKTEA